MKVLSRVLSIATKRGVKFDRWLCTNSPSVSNILIHRLLQQPISSIKTTLGSSDSIAVINASDFSWDDFLVSLNSTSPDKAHLVLQWRLEELLKANEKDHNLYSHLIFLSGKIQSSSFALKVFSSMENNGVKPNSSVFNSLILACLHSGNVTSAISLYEIMNNSEIYKPDSNTYDTFINGFSKLGNYKLMHAWYSAKRAFGFNTNIQTFESLISCCVKVSNFDSADKYYEEMLSLGLIPSIFVLENMIYTFCKRRNFDKINEFLKNAFEINGKIVKMLANFYFEFRSVDEMEELFTNLMKLSESNDVLCEIHYGIIRKYVILDKLDGVEYATGRMLKQGISFTNEDDVQKVICLYFKRETYDRLELFLDAIKGSYKLTKSNYILLISGYKRVGLFEKLNLSMEDMKLTGFS